MLLFLAVTIRRGAQWVVFQPNHERSESEAQSLFVTARWLRCDQLDSDVTSSPLAPAMTPHFLRFDEGIT